MSTIATIDFDTVHYDPDADVLYLSIGDPARAVDFEESPDGHALRYDEHGDLIGITIVGARKLVNEHRDVPMSFDTNLPGNLTDDDRLFNVDRGSWELNTRMDWTFLREYRYIAGFERAAQVLGDHAAESRADVDALTMPILFCYRQWAELQLKALWYNGSRLIGREPAPLKTHDLRVLWRHVRPIIETVWPEGDRTELDRLERVWAAPGGVKTDGPFASRLKD